MNYIRVSIPVDFTSVKTLVTSGIEEENYTEDQKALMSDLKTGITTIFKKCDDSENLHRTTPLKASTVTKLEIDRRAGKIISSDIDAIKFGFVSYYPSNSLIKDIFFIEGSGEDSSIKSHIDTPCVSFTSDVVYEEKNNYVIYTFRHGNTLQIATDAISEYGNHFDNNSTEDPTSGLVTVSINRDKLFSLIDSYTDESKLENEYEMFEDNCLEAIRSVTDGLKVQRNQHILEEQQRLLKLILSANNEEDPISYL